MPGEVKTSAIKKLSKKLTAITNLVIVLILLSLASQFFLMVSSYGVSINFWLSMLLVSIVIMLGLVGAKAAVETNFSLSSLNAINFLIMGILLWLVKASYSSDTLFLVGLIIIAVYVLSISFVSKYEHLKLDFLKLDKTRLEKQGLNFKRQGQILDDVKVNLIVIDVLVVAIWLASQSVNVILISNGLALLICQYLLWQLFQFSIKGINWFLSEFEVDFRVFRRCLSWSLLLVLVVTSLSLLVPIKYGGSFTKLVGQQFNGWGQDITLDKNYNLGGNVKEQVTRKRLKDRKVKQTEDIKWYWALFAIASMIAALLAIIGTLVILFFLFKGEYEQIKKIPQLIKNWLKSIVDLVVDWKELFLGQVENIKATWQQEEVSQSSQKSRGQKEISDQASKEVKNLLQELINVLENEGYQRKNYETLEEYFNSVENSLSLLKEELTWSQKVIEQGFYSQTELNPQTKEELKEVVEKVKTNFTEQ